MEFLGNILDNAKQWAKSRVGIDILQQDGNVVVTISGDGPGRPEEKLRIPPRTAARSDDQWFRLRLSD
jgi:hypothetical protein